LKSNRENIIWVFGSLGRVINRVRVTMEGEVHKMVGQIVDLLVRGLGYGRDLE
jgi:hypothetical protein